MSRRDIERAIVVHLLDGEVAEGMRLVDELRRSTVPAPMSAAEQEMARELGGRSWGPVRGPLAAPRWEREDPAVEVVVLADERDVESIEEEDGR